MEKEILIYEIVTVCNLVRACENAKNITCGNSPNNKNSKEICTIHSYIKDGFMLIPISTGKLITKKR